MANVALDVTTGPTDKFDLTERKNALKIEIFASLAALLVVSISMIHFSVSGKWVLIAGALLVPTVFIHEITHYGFQWLFSHQRPRRGFKFPFPYSALAPGARISRNQGIFCAFAPFLFISLVLTLISLLANTIPKVIPLILACFHVASCAGDFLLINWLLRHPKDVKLGTVGLSNALFRNEDP